MILSRHIKIGAVLFIPYLLLVLVHFLFSVPVYAPMLVADELGYLGNARYLAGVAHLPDLRGTAFYHFGYSTFLLPLFWLFADPVSIYRAAIFLNSILMSSLYFPLFYLLRVPFRSSLGVAAVISFTTCLYPSFLLQSKLAWAENAFIPLFALLIALFGALLDNKKSPTLPLVLGFVVGVLYTVHPRALPVLVVAIAYISFLGLLKILPRCGVFTCIATTLLTFVATRLLNNHLIELGWGGQGGDPSIYYWVSKMLSVREWFGLLVSAAAQILYLIVATYGLFFLGLSYMIAEITKVSALGFRALLHDDKVHLLAFSIFSSCGIFIASFLFMADAGFRGDHYFYGRYNEGFLAVFLAIALWSLHLAKESKSNDRGYFSTTLVITALAIFVLSVHRNELLSKTNIAAFNLWGVYPIIREVGVIDLSTITLIGLFLFLSVKTVFDKTFIGGIVLTAAVFLSVTGYNRTFLETWHAAGKAHADVVSVWKDLGKIEKVSWDISFRQNWFFTYQYLLPKVSFDGFNSERQESPSSSIVISRKGWSDAGRFEAVPMISARTSLTLWILPGEYESLIPSVLNKKLGIHLTAGVRETGFHQEELPPDSSPHRWTNGNASLVVNVRERRPRSLRIDLKSTGRKGMYLEILVDGHEVFGGPLPGGSWSKSFNLSKLPLGKWIKIELLSDTFVPKEVTGSTDTRTLGVAVGGIWLLDEIETP